MYVIGALGLKVLQIIIFLCLNIVHNRIPVLNQPLKDNGVSVCQKIKMKKTWSL